MKAYQRVRITTATPGELVVMLLEGLVRFTLRAKEAILEDQPVDTAVAVERAGDIIVALREALNHDAAPAMSATLDRTYTAWNVCLVRAHAERDVESFDAIAQQMNDLVDAWRTIVRQGAGKTLEVVR
ncbi:MAG: flagellar export chaperone FliS [Myxococcota bacterium]